MAVALVNGHVLMTRGKIELLSDFVVLVEHPEPGEVIVRIVIDVIVKKK